MNMIRKYQDIPRLFLMEDISQNSQKIIKFDYEALPAQKRTSIQQEVVEIKKRIRHTALTIWEIGEKLFHVRSQMNSRQFCSWLKVEFDWSQRTAYNFINVYQAFPDFANFAKIDIPISSLYQLAAPSTPQYIRSQFLNKAIAGQKITFQGVKKAIKQAKQQLIANDKITGEIPLSNINVHSDMHNFQSKNTMPTKLQESEIACASLESCEATAKSSDNNVFELKSEPVSYTGTTNSSAVRLGWNQVKSGFLLFYGDTASSEFIECLPQEGFILAILSGQWHHNWLLSNSRNFIIFHPSTLNEHLIDNFLSELSQSENAIILPWLPSWKTMGLILKLDIKIYAGDQNFNRCEKVLSKLGLN